MVGVTTSSLLGAVRPPAFSRRGDADPVVVMVGSTRADRAARQVDAELAASDSRRSTDG
jgi:hypothetical protein